MKNGPMFSPSPSPSYPPSPINKRLFLYTARIMPTKGFTTWVGFSHTTFQFASEETHDSQRFTPRTGELACASAFKECGWCISSMAGLRICCLSTS